MNINTRELILSILMELNKTGEYSNILIAAVLDKYDYLDAREKAFIKHVTEGTIERRLQVDYIINLYSKTPVHKMKPLIRELLRMSVYQLVFMEHIPDSAVCNEAVKLAKNHKFQSLQGFVNGVLRTIARNKTKIEYPVREQSVTEYLSVKYSIPEWLVHILFSQYGEAVCERIFGAFLERQPVSIRLDETISEQQRNKLLADWQKQGVESRVHPYLPYAVTIQKMDGIRNLQGYEEGLFTVQDVSSMLVAECAGIQSGDTVLDVCAAPGGKALHAACKLGHTGKVIACDVSEYKTDKIRDNADRLHTDNLTVCVKDASVFCEALEGIADVLIADVPCSGLGVIGKKQDIKYRVTKESLDEIIILQKKIMTNVVRYVKKEGVLMYSTCTVNRMENEEMVQWICEQFGFETVSMEEYLPKQLKEEGKKGYLQLLPGIHETDGFFIAKLKRNEK